MFPDYDDDEDQPKIDAKFGVDCEGCKNLRRPKICQGCDSGEFYEECDPEGLDFIF